MNRMNLINLIALFLFGWTAGAFIMMAGFYVSIGWYHICDRLAIVGMITLLMLFVITLAQAEAETSREDNDDDENDNDATTENTDRAESDS